MAKRVAFIFTHRIQYITNLLDELSKRGTVEPLAIYARETSRVDDPGFARRVRWDNRQQIACREVILQKTTNHLQRHTLGSFSLRLNRALASFQPASVHLNGYSDAIQWQALWWARSQRVPIFLRGDGDTLSERKSLFDPLKRRLARLFTKRAHVVFFQGEENKKFWLENGARADRLCWIPCVSDTEIFQKRAFSSTEERLKFREVHGARGDDVVFLVSGKLISRKRPADAIRALNQSREARTHLWFLGSGPLEDDLKRLTAELGLNDRVEFWGFKNQTEMPSILQAADVMVHPSEHDPWPYAVLEGAHSGLALLLSDCTGSCVDWIDRYRAGLSFRCRDVDSLASAMRAAATDQDKRRAWQKSAREVAQVHTETKFCEILEQAVLLETRM
jgi:glycosyltransferase involved in cell wall biosynthesis